MNKHIPRPRSVGRIVLVSAILLVVIYGVLHLFSSSSLQAYRVATPRCEAKAITDLTVDETLMLVNEHYPLEDTFSPHIDEYQDSDVWMNEALHSAYRTLAEAVKAETGDTLYISSAARNRDEQTALYKDDPSIAQKPGCSEHETGLALDVYVESYAGMGFIKSEAGRFVNTHCEEYGFIIRYPLFGEGKTGIPYEPWHIRYVGKIHAELITRLGMTLEEYIDALVPNEFYLVDDHIISRQPLKDGTLAIPENCVNPYVSPDNTGYYIITGKVNSE